MDLENAHYSHRTITLYPENLAKSISIEAGELLECFQWNNNYDKDKNIKREEYLYQYQYSYHYH